MKSTVETGRSRTSSYASPKSFMPKQPQIMHNFKANSNEKLFQRAPFLKERGEYKDFQDYQGKSDLYKEKAEIYREKTDFIKEFDTNPKYKLSPNSFNFDSERVSPKISNENLEDFEKNDDFYGFSNTNPQNLQASKAYIHAMKALQTRNKLLEDEKKDLDDLRIKEKEGFEKQLKEFEGLLNEKTGLFASLENNLKEKLLAIEEEYNSVLNRNKMLENEHLLLKEEKEKQQDNYNRSLRECLAEKNELKASLKIYEDKCQFLRQENESLRQEIGNSFNLKQDFESNVINMQEKINSLQEALKNKTVDYEKEREKSIEKFRSNESYYEKLLEQELNEKQEIYRELNDLKSEFEKLSTSNQEVVQRLLEKENENLLIQEKFDSTLKENNQVKQFAEYTQEINEKLINNFINESMTNISNSRNRPNEILTPISNKHSNNILNKTPPEYIDMKKNNDILRKSPDYSRQRLFTLENQEKGNEYPSFRNRKEQYKVEYEATVRAITEMERELRELIEKYKIMSLKIEVDKHSRESTLRLQSEMLELNELISNITQELRELKRNEERLSILAK